MINNFSRETSDFERIELHGCLLLEIRSGVERICAARDWAIRRPPPPPDTAGAGDFVCGQHTSCGPFTEAAGMEVHPRPNVVNTPIMLTASVIRIVGARFLANGY